MANYQTKVKKIQAVQFDGTNSDDVTAIVGDRFADATKWLSWAQEGQWVLWTNNTWQIVAPNLWVIVAEDGTFSLMDDTTFNDTYESTTAAKRTTKRAASKATSGKQG
jgi:hypothetical protein